LEIFELHDLGFTGDVFTWHNKQIKGGNYIRERSDRAVANFEWLQRFSLVHVQNGDPYHSDHRPIIISTEGLPPRRPAPDSDNFKFEASWLKEDDCRRVVEETWNSMEGSGLTFSHHLKGVASSLKEWSSCSLGDLEKRLKHAKRELERWRRAEISDFAVGREAIWSYKVDRLEEPIDVYWKHRAHINWLNFGDRNTSYFHHACSERKRRNIIGNLKKEDGGWVENEDEKKTFITNFFSQLFRSNGIGDERHRLLP
jgi:hypothetical protein